MSVNTSESLEHKARVTDLLEKLRKKLNAFTIINLQGQVVGRIRDFCLDKNRRLFMIISDAESRSDSPLFLLSSKYIQKVDTSNRVVFVDLSLGEIERLPVYQRSNSNVTQPLDHSSTPPVTQVSTASSGEMPDVGETYFQEEIDHENFSESEYTPEVVAEEIVSLLEERLVVNLSKRKVGEVVVRKEIETRIVEVPIQREILIIEQVGAETKQLAVIDLGREEVTGVEAKEGSSFGSLQKKAPSSEHPYTVVGEFLSPKAASNLLEAIALQGRHGCKKVRVELVVDTPELQDNYQKMFDRCSIQ